ncbi:MAG: hypothetical protein HY778_08495 [Betaproteobacteria bacterium]|nr:hypothetical protein [Betaproteobacteria bacterium]
MTELLDRPHRVQGQWMIIANAGSRSALAAPFMRQSATRGAWRGDNQAFVSVRGAG